MSPPTPDTTRLSLVVALKNPADRAAWAAFAERYGPVVRRWCLGQCRAVGLADAEFAADEVAAGVLANIHARVRGYDPGRHRLGGFRKWLRTVALHALADYTRARRRHHGTGDSSLLDRLEQVPAREGLGDAVADEHRRELLAAVVLPAVRREFADRQWAAVMALGLGDGRARGGRPAADVAREFGYQPGSLFQLKRQVLARIRHVLSELDPEPTHDLGP